MWLFVPSPFAPAPRGSSLDSTSLSRDSSGPFVTVNAKPTPLRRFLTKSRQVSFPRLLCGITSKPSAMQRAAELWAASTRSSGDTPASRSARPGEEMARTILATYGRSSVMRLAFTNRACVFSRTSQATLLSDSIPFSLIYSRWATALRQACLRRRKSAQPTSENDCSSWPTARREDGESCGNHPDATDSLTGATKLWQTPIVPTSPKTRRQVGATEREALLPAQAAMWHTPTTPDRGPETKDSKATRPNTGGIDLQTEAKLWNTDSSGKLGGAGGGEFAKQANNWKPPKEINHANDTHGLSDVLCKYYLGGPCSPGSAMPSVPLPLWPTPAGRDYRTPNSADSQANRNEGSARGQQLPNFVDHSFPPAPATCPDGSVSLSEAPTLPPLSIRAALERSLTPDGSIDWSLLESIVRRAGGRAAKRLNPRFVEWLMGLPRDWTQCDVQCKVARAACDYAETVWSLWKQRMRRRLLRLLCSKVRGERLEVSSAPADGSPTDSASPPLTSNP